MSLVCCAVGGLEVTTGSLVTVCCENLLDGVVVLAVTGLASSLIVTFTSPLTNDFLIPAMLLLPSCLPRLGFLVETLSCAAVVDTVGDFVLTFVSNVYFLVGVVISTCGVSFLDKVVFSIISFLDVLFSVSFLIFSTSFLEYVLFSVSFLLLILLLLLLVSPVLLLLLVVSMSLFLFFVFSSLIELRESLGPFSTESFLRKLEPVSALRRLYGVLPLAELETCTSSGDVNPMKHQRTFNTVHLVIVNNAR